MNFVDHDLTSSDGLSCDAAWIDNLVVGHALVPRGTGDGSDARWQSACRRSSDGSVGSENDRGTESVMLLLEKTGLLVVLCHSDLARDDLCAEHGFDVGHEGVEDGAAEP